jgi:SAM-dependent methyltransferase
MNENTISNSEISPHGSVSSIGTRPEPTQLQGAAPTSYTHGHADAVLRSHRWRTAENSAAYLLPRLRPSDSLLDVGCGPGTLTADLARHVDSRLVVGVDLAASVVEEARAFALSVNVDATFVHGDFRTVTPPNAGFDVVHAHQVLQHVEDPIATLAAMAALARPGGLIAARDADYPAMTWFPDEPLLDRWLDVYVAVTRRNNAEAAAGRRLLHWALAAGLDDVRYSTSTWTFSTEVDLTWWTELWADRITVTRLAEQAIAYGVASKAELADIAGAWRSWRDRDGATFTVLHGEILGRAPR